MSNTQSNEDLLREIQNETDANQRDYLENELFRRNIEFCHYIVQSYQNTKFDRDELFSLAQFGFAKALRTYDLEKGFKFVSYAGRCMHNQILMALRNAKRKLDTKSLDEGYTNAEGDVLTYMDIVPCEAYETFNRMEDRLTLKLLLQNSEEILSPNERACILNAMAETPLTGVELGKRLGIAQSYTSRLLYSAQRKLRRYAKEHDILPKIGYTCQEDPSAPTKEGLTRRVG